MITESQLASQAPASDGLYRSDHHLAIQQGRAKPGRDPKEVVASHVRRLEALRRAGIVERVAGVYRRNVMLASGRYAMLDDGVGFSLVPWRPVIEQRLGQQLATTMRGGRVSWEIGRQRQQSIG
ncbi:DUF3363 domain-containing protein [Pusillimonas sp.]|uniref:DUF3363 domain-containing protein n=1 Tax=Pusillimonas sp. TaxID=3040095 RepID=UPI0029BFB3ED|nr:DUF3363 domain-containing protein [Pusillimonas sp.]